MPHGGGYPAPKDGRQVSTEARVPEFGSFLRQPPEPGMERQPGHRPANRSHELSGSRAPKSMRDAGPIPMRLRRRGQPGEFARVLHSHTASSRISGRGRVQVLLLREKDAQPTEGQREFERTALVVARTPMPPPCLVRFFSPAESRAAVKAAWGALKVGLGLAQAAMVTKYTFGAGGASSPLCWWGGHGLPGDLVG